MTGPGPLLLDDPWRVEPGDFPERAGSRDKLAFLLHYAVLAPSILNTQPWSFRVSDDGVLILADPSRHLPVTDPSTRELIISCGAALLNLRLAARSFGYELAVAPFPLEARPEVVAHARLLAAEAGADDRRLREAMTARRTCRTGFAARPVPDDLRDRLAAAVRQEGAEIAFIDAAQAKRRVSRLVVEAERTLLADPAFRREIAAWIEARVGEAQERNIEARQRLHEALADGAGHTPEARPQPELFTPMAADVARRSASEEAAAEDRRAQAEGAPLLALLATRHDSPADWLAAGQSLQRALLVAAADGASASFLNPPIEVRALRPRVAAAFGVRGRAQVLLGLGYAPGRPPTARRPMREVVL